MAAQHVTARLGPSYNTGVLNPILTERSPPPNPGPGLRTFPDTFRVRHCLSTPAPGTAVVKGKTQKGERMTKGRVDHKVLKAEFGRKWADGKPIQVHLWQCAAAL